MISTQEKARNAPPISHAELLELLHYDPLTGAWTWKQNRSSNKVRAGMKAGSISGYGHGSMPRYFVCVKGKVYLGARLAWFYMTGEWPAETIDHIDFDSLNDRWINLRQISLSENSRRRRDRGYT